MRAFNPVIIVSALAFGAAATLGARVLLKSPPKAPDAAQVVQVKAEHATIVVVSRPLPFGARVTPDAVREIPWPADAVPKGVVTRSADLFAGAPRTVLKPLVENEPLMTSALSEPGRPASLSGMIGKNMSAVTIRVDDVVGVAGFVQPEDRVDVLMTRADRLAEPAGGAGAQSFSDTILRNVRVLGTDQTVEPTASARPARSVTIEVTNSEAQKIALASSVGQLSLALRNNQPDGDIDAGTRTTLRELGLSAVAARDPVAVNPSTVTVTRGTERKNYEVTDATAEEEKAPLQAANRDKIGWFLISTGDRANGGANGDRENGAR